MGLLIIGVPSEPTLCRVENGIDEPGRADKMIEFAMAFHVALLR